MALGGRAVPTLWCVDCLFWAQNTEFCHPCVFVPKKRPETETLEEKRLRNGWVIVPHQPPTVVNRWWRGVGARVVLELANIVASRGPFGAPFEAREAEPTRK